LREGGEELAGLGQHNCGASVLAILCFCFLARQAHKMFWGALKQGKILDSADSFSVLNKHVSSLVPKKLQKLHKH